MTPHAPEKGALSPNSRGPRTSHGPTDLLRNPGPPTEPRILLRHPGPPSGAGTLIYYPDPSAGREPTPRLRLVRSRHMSTGTDTHTVVRLHWKTRPPTAFNAGDVSALCHSRARGDFCQAVLLIARYQGAQCSHWRRPRHARQSATLVRHDSSALPIITPVRWTQQSTLQPTLPQRAPRRWDR